MEEPIDMFEYWRLHARRAGKRSAVDFVLRMALACGEHVHVADPDGHWCLDGTCDTGTDMTMPPQP